MTPPPPGGGWGCRWWGGGDEGVWRVWVVGVGVEGGKMFKNSFKKMHPKTYPPSDPQPPPPPNNLWISAKFGPPPHSER